MTRPCVFIPPCASLPDEHFFFSLLSSSLLFSLSHTSLFPLSPLLILPLPPLIILTPYCSPIEPLPSHFPQTISDSNPSLSHSLTYSLSHNQSLTFSVFNSLTLTLPLRSASFFFAHTACTHSSSSYTSTSHVNTCTHSREQADHQ